jgi:16S rRNA (adenine1518-N6/adenine1519-N6)-dimethyltransferase
MSLTSPTAVHALLAELGVTPSKVLGQNFLIDRNIRDIILNTADIQPRDIVLEIGPGLGVLTEELARRARGVVAVEKDRRLFAYLEQAFRAVSRVELIEADMLELDTETLLAKGISRVVSNLPFSSGSRMLVTLFLAARPPESITATVQREVAERLVAGPGQAARGFLSVAAQSAYEVCIVKKVSPTCFYPRPDVQSAVVQCVRRPGYQCGSAAERALLPVIVKRAFTYRRKQMGTVMNHLARDLRIAPEKASDILVRAAVITQSRPEDLTVEKWRLIASEFIYK